MVKITPENVNIFIKLLKDSGMISTKDLADRHYSTAELYEHRLMMFKILCSTYFDLAWKTKTHYDGSMFNGSFLAGISTPEGNATYHFKLPHYDEFVIPEIEFGPKYDGYTIDDVLSRLDSLPLIEDSYIDTGNGVIYDPNCELYSLINGSVDSSTDLEYLKELSHHFNEIVKILRNKNVIDINDISDTNHTFRDLYKQRRNLFRLICHNYIDLAWKSERDSSGEAIFEDKFIAGLNTPLGPVCYVFNKDHYDEFVVEELSKAPINKDEIMDDVLRKLSSIKIRRMK
jgi:hypothetical protein